MRFKPNDLDFVNHPFPDPDGFGMPQEVSIERIIGDARAQEYYGQGVRAFGVYHPAHPVNLPEGPSYVYARLFDGTSYTFTCYCSEDGESWRPLEKADLPLAVLEELRATPYVSAEDFAAVEESLEQEHVLRQELDAAARLLAAHDFAVVGKPALASLEKAAGKPASVESRLPRPEL
jgi:hypothetical protein